jgi:hypothetical protein
MNRRDRDRYDHDGYNRDYNDGAGYSRDDGHYHSARNLTNEFEQHYRSYHRDWENVRDSDRFRPHRSYREEDGGGDYSHRRQGEDRDFRGRDYGFQQHDRGRDFSDNYSSRNRYSQRNDGFGGHARERYGESDRYSNQAHQGGRGQDRMREGYGISDYGRMGQSSIHSNRGVPNAGITSNPTDDFGSTDFDRDRSYGISSGSYGGYGSYSGGFGRNRNDR